MSILDRILNEEIRRRPSPQTGYVNASYVQDFTKKKLPGRPKKRRREQIRKDLKSERELSKL